MSELVGMKRTSKKPTYRMALLQLVIAIIQDERGECGPDRFPGHCHNVDGRWDDDNPPAHRNGEACQLCWAWKQAWGMIP